MGRILALLTLLFCLPVLALFALAIQAQGRGSILYRQPREGKNRCVFTMFKLRTMLPDAEQRLEQLLASDAALADEWYRFGSLRNDPRIAGRIGRWARAFSIDEIPQLVNVVRGDMAWVGPRPLPLMLAQAMPPGVQEARCQILPGLTGLSQICGRSRFDLRRMRRYDRLYIEQRNWRLDVWIIVRTPAVLLLRRGLP